MRTYRLKLWIILIFSVTSIVLSSTSQDETLETILQKNVEASGGLEAISKIGAVSLEQIATRTPSLKPIKYLVWGKDRIKVLEGVSPIVEKSIVLNENRIFANSVEGLVAPESINKTELYCFAHLISGNFSLYNFKGELEKIGLKKSGTFESYVLR
jgi:hypothetical protein